MKYNRSTKGRAIFLAKAYRERDSCDMTSEEIRLLIEMPCHYCGTETLNRGLDRIDNTLGHVRGNVLPACAACNIARNAIFTVEEMRTIGDAIRKVWEKRVKDSGRDPARNEDHLAVLGSQHRRQLGRRVTSRWTSLALQGENTKANPI